MCRDDTPEIVLLRSFLTFAGGPGNKPTCAGETLRYIGDEMLGTHLRSTVVEEGLKAGKFALTAKALKYAAKQPNSAGGIGLLCLRCSAVFRRIMSGAEVLGEASEAILPAEVGHAAFSSTFGEESVAEEALKGGCAAAFPILH